MFRRICLATLGLLLLVGCGSTNRPAPTPSQSVDNLQVVKDEAERRGYDLDLSTVGYGGGAGDARHGVMLFKTMPSMQHPDDAHIGYWEVTEAGVVKIGCFNADGNYGVDDFLEYPDQWAHFIREGTCPRPRLQPAVEATA